MPTTRSGSSHAALTRKKAAACEQRNAVVDLLNARQRSEQEQSREREPAIMAFGGNEQSRMIGFLGN